MSKSILPIVEGDGDMAAVPVLLRRILHAHDRFDVQVLPPHKRGELPKVKANFERFFKAAALNGVPVLCVLDFDCAQCVDAISDEQNLEHQAQKINPLIPFAACLIVKEFESLFLWDEKSTRQALPNIIKNTIFPINPEEIRPAKEWLSKVQPSGLAYKPTVHQAKLAAAVNLEVLRANSPSYQRLEAAVMKLIK